MVFILWVSVFYIYVVMSLMIKKVQSL